MTIFANGPPKAGTHALMKCLGLLGLEREPGMVQCYVKTNKLRLKGTRADPETRLLREVLDDIDSRAFIHSHVHDGILLGDNPVITVFRDPRNMVISAARFRVAEGKITKVTDAQIIDVIEYEFYRKHAVELIRGFLGWRECEGTLCIKFEDLIGDQGETTKAIAEYLGVAWRARAYDDLIGLAGGYQLYATARRDHNTWSGALSKWQEWWSPGIEEAWVKAEGPELVKDMGYE